MIEQPNNEIDIHGNPIYIRKHRRAKVESEIEKENRLIREWLDAGNKPKVFNKPFEEDDYGRGMVRSKAMVQSFFD